MADVTTTNAVNVALYDEAGNRVGVTASPLVQQDNKVSGTWGYLAGINGTITVPAGAKVLQIAVAAPTDAAATFTINGGATITVPASQALTIEPRGNLVAPTIVVSGASSYFVEHVT